MTPSAREGFARAVIALRRDGETPKEIALKTRRPVSHVTTILTRQANQMERRAVVELMSDGRERTINDVATVCGFDRASTGRHLHKLQSMGLLTSVLVDKTLIYRKASA